MPRRPISTIRKRRPTLTETPPDRPPVYLDTSDFGHALTDYEEYEVAMARALYEAWNAERGKQRRFIGGGEYSWFALSAKDRVLWCEVARATQVYVSRIADLPDEQYNALLTEAGRV